MARTAATLLAAALALGCAPPAQLRYERRLDETPGPARHGVYSQRIQELMRSVSRLEAERLPQAMDVERERGRRIDDVVRIALELADSADAIAAAAPELGLEPDEQAEFIDYAHEFSRSTRELATRAPELTPAETTERTRAIRRTCDGCHDRFRIPTGSAAP